MLEFTWPAFGFAVVNFLILTALLWKFLHEPLLNALDKRQKSIDEERARAESETKKATETRAEYEARLKGAAAECDTLLADARKTAEENSAKTILEATEQAKRTVADLEQAAEREQKQALASLQETVTDSALSVAGSILAKISDEGIEAKLFAALLNELKGIGKSEGDEVRVASARKLGKEQQAEILKHIASDESQVEFAVDESLVAGVRVEFSDRVVDATLADVLARVDESVKTGEDAA